MSNSTSLYLCNRRKLRAIKVMIAAAVGACFLGQGPGIASATTYSWKDVGTAWETGGDWTPSGPPTAADLAQFTPQTGTSVLNPTLTSASDTALSLTLGQNITGGGWTFGGAGVLTLGGTGSTGLTTYGAATYTFNGPTLAGASGSNTVVLNVATDSTLVLSGSSKITSNQGNFNINGGTVQLDNSTTNATDRLTTTGTIKQQGSGVFQLIGGSAGGTYNVGSYNTADNSVGGFNTIRITANTSSADTTLNFANTGTFSLRQGTRNVTLFDAGSGQLGLTHGPHITFAGTPFIGSGGLLTNSSGGTTPGWAIVSDSFGTNFATYSTTAGVGIVSLASAAAKPTGATITTVTTASQLQALTAAGTSNAGSNGQFNTSTTPNTTTDSTGANISAATLRISPGSTGGALAMGANNLLVAGLMLDGATDYSITATTSPGSLFAGTHYLYVNNASTTLSLGLLLTTSGNQVVVAGPGFVDLTNSVSQNAAGTGRITIAGGVLRANNTQLGLTASGSGQLNLTGGVLEIKNGANGTGAAADFSRTLGTGTGTVNWSATGAEQGSGGFSAIGSAASVNINGSATPATLTWNSTANFVADGFALKFGSTKSNAVLNFLNPIALDSLTAGNYAAREINVTAGVGGDKTVLAGAITGSSTTDLIKTGTGVLDLTANNTYSGNTLIQGGTLRARNSTASTGAGSVSVNSGGTLGGDGKITGPVIVNSGGTLAAGADAATIGTLTTSGGETWSGGGTYSPKLAAGNSSDKVAITSGLTLTATNGNKFNVTATGASGSISPLVSEKWAIGTTNSISGFTQAPASVGQTVSLTDQFVLTVPSSLFTSTPSGTFGLSLTQLSGSSYELDATYNVAPEPGTAVLVLAGAMPMLVARRRKAVAASR